MSTPTPAQLAAAEADRRFPAELNVTHESQYGSTFVIPEAFNIVFRDGAAFEREQPIVVTPEMELRAYRQLSEEFYPGEDVEDMSKRERATMNRILAYALSAREETP